MSPSPPRIPAKIAKALITPNGLISAPALIAPTLAPSDPTLPVLKPQQKRMQPVVVIASGPRYQSSNRIVGTRCSHFAVWLLRVRRIRQSYDTSSPSRHRLAASAHSPEPTPKLWSPRPSSRPAPLNRASKKHCPVSTGNGQVCQHAYSRISRPRSKHASSANRTGA